MANGNPVTLQHGGAYEITLSRSGERGLVVEVFDMEEDASSVAPMTPDEWDCFVARGNKALGREQGATVPRAGVAAVVALFETNAIAADKGEQYGKDTRNAHLEACSKAEAKVWRRAAAEARATLEAAGLWPLPSAPTGER
jgi:hypothetical protein